MFGVKKWNKHLPVAAGVLSGITEVQPSPETPQSRLFTCAHTLGEVVCAKGVKDKLFSFLANGRTETQIVDNTLVASGLLSIMLSFSLVMVCKYFSNCAGELSQFFCCFI